MTQAQYTPGRILIILLGAGFLLVAIFSVIARNYSESGHVTMPQYDSAIYMQYARAIAEGHPYRFNESDPPSTGSTSHLYPLVLAVPYVLGAKGDALVTVGFFLGGLCYLGIIALVYLIARKLVPDLAVVAAVIAGVLNGHALFACIGVTDVGLYAVVALSVISAALYRYWKLAALGLVIAVFTRPEGAVLSATFFATGLVAFLVKKDERKHALPLLIVGAVGILAVVAMLGLNYLLTGITTFHSVLSKSRGLYYPPSESLFISLNDGGKIIREFLFGLSGQGRQFYMLPVVGGLLGIIGLSVRQREDKTESLVEVAFLLACVGAVALVTQSGWQGFFWDRYFAWLLPLWLIYVIAAVDFLRKRLFQNRYPWMILLGILLAWQCIGMVHFASVFSRLLAKMEPRIAFLRDLSEEIDPSATIMSRGLTGTLIWYLPENYHVNFDGIVTPQLTYRAGTLANIEVLKRNPELRGDFWIFEADLAEQQPYSLFIDERIDNSPLVMAETKILGLHEADWSLLEYPDTPLSTQTLQTAEGWELVDRLDVVHPDDEKESHYSVYNRFEGARAHPFAKVSKIGGREICDLGRIIYGTESFRVQCPRPGEDMLVVLRTALSGTLGVVEPLSGVVPRRMSFDSPVRLRIFVDGVEIGSVEKVIEEGEDKFAEIAFVIPGKALKGPEADLIIGGDHFSFAYWFYQPSSVEASR